MNTTTDRLAALAVKIADLTIKEMAYDAALAAQQQQEVAKVNEQDAKARAEADQKIKDLADKGHGGQPVAPLPIDHKPVKKPKKS